MYNVLLIDSDPHAFNTFRPMISRDACGIDLVRCEPELQQVLSFLDSCPVDIAIINVSFQEIDGIHLLRQIRSRQPDIRCIFLAKPEDVTYVQKAIPLGIENFLLTPVVPALLMETLHSAVKSIAQQCDSKKQANHGCHLHKPAYIYPAVQSAYAFEQLILNQEYAECLVQLDALFSNIRDCEAVPVVLQNHMVELAVFVINALRRHNIANTELIDDTTPLFYNIINCNNTNDLYVLMRSFLKTAFDTLEGKNIPFSPCIAKVVSHIEKNYAQDISLKTLSYDLNINPAYLGQQFKQETGQLFSVFLNKVRIENAKKLLLNTTLTLSDISQKCGYTNTSYFYNIFKKYTNQTPSQFRKSRGK